MKDLNHVLSSIKKEIDFSGTVLVQQGNGPAATVSFGFSNRADQVKNNTDTRFGIASGCKLFTAIAICQLVEDGKLTFDTRLKDCVDVDFPHFSDEITIHHLLTHTSGIPNYFDEENMDFAELWTDRPMYQIRRVRDFLPMFENEQMESAPGEAFHYNDAGFILLGLIVEKASKMEFTDYVEEHIFKKAGMADSGYFSMDRLPANTAFGYIDSPDGTWKTNIYSLPVKGGPDGGAYITVNDMAKLWKALFGQLLLKEETLARLLTPHAQVNETGYHGYGIWIKKEPGYGVKYHVMGYDPGVSFHSAYYPDTKATVVVCSNKSQGAYDIMAAVEKELL